MSTSSFLPDLMVFLRRVDYADPQKCAEALDHLKRFQQSDPAMTRALRDIAGNDPNPNVRDLAQRAAGLPHIADPDRLPVPSLTATTYPSRQRDVMYRPSILSSSRSDSLQTVN